ncbi:hypothetical protein ACFW9X_42440, partial [Streptomyces sp. NPDC059466]
LRERAGAPTIRDIAGSVGAGQTAVSTVLRGGRGDINGVWDSQPHWNLSYTSPDEGPLYDQGNQQKVFSTVSSDLSASSPNAAPFTEGGSVYTSSVRYDYAGKIAGKFLGTVFTQARVELVLSQKDPAVNESALHIYDALNRPECTFPSWPGKTVPGMKEPLHRLVDKEKQKKNRARSIKECEKVWGDYRGLQGNGSSVRRVPVRLRQGGLDQG